MCNQPGFIVINVREVTQPNNIEYLRKSFLFFLKTDKNEIIHNPRIPKANLGSPTAYLNCVKERPTLVDFDGVPTTVLVASFIKYTGVYTNNKKDMAKTKKNILLLEKSNLK